MAMIMRRQAAYTLNDFERKLIETDAYLQLLLSQIKDLDVKIKDCQNERDKKQLVEIKAKTLSLLDGVKHTIVLLQIAKNTSYPVNGLFEESTSQSTQTQSSKESLENVNQSLFKSNNSRPQPEQGEVESNSTSKSVPQPVLPEPIDSDLIHEVSYSSDDDDDFYDAHDETPNLLSPDNRSENELIMEKLKLDSPKRLNSGEIDYDAIYEEEENELGSIEVHGSIISHLISQVKIGMDLTKVVLPTFILERRSLLEMYADFFAHPDLFISITDYETPQERMIQVLKWYLSAFHAGRKSSIAKKPYNPVLGEVFKCFWHIDGSHENGQPTNDGPVPWATNNNLTFVAEQVSHHPPISAFYAEHIKKRIMCSAYIWTKSKFLGLSIGVNNIGFGSIYLLDKGEEYICTFPSAYGRSILTVPWVELGGSVSIKCQQTGYSANIDFITKPFYGGKKHRVAAEVFGPPPTKKSILTVTGEWNGVMTAKWPDGQTEVFVDTKSMPIIKKRVKKIVEQDSYESRNIWKEVTAALRSQDVNAATNAKIAIEEQQRELVRDRKEKGTQIKNKLFHQLGDNWRFNSPLTTRSQKTSKSTPN